MSLFTQTLVLAGTACLFTVAVHAQDTFTDDFNRADNTDPGSDWTEVVGDWEIFDATIRSRPDDTTTEKLLVHEALLIDRAFTIEADIDWPILRNQWNGVVWRFDATNNNYYLFRMRGDNGRVQIIKRIAGNTHVLADQTGAVSIVEGEFHRISVRGDGKGTIWWSVSVGDEIQGNGGTFDSEPLEPGSSGIYGGRESISVNRFFVETVDELSATMEIRVVPAVEVTFPTTAGRYYLIEKSFDQESWTANGPPIQGDGTEISRLFPIPENGKPTFRVLTSAESP